VNLEKRLNLLEELATLEEENLELPYTFDDDWSKKEIKVMVAAIKNNTEPPKELFEKHKLTRPSGRLADYSEEEIAEIHQELLEKGSDF
jgi:hypothetical protein